MEETHEAAILCKTLYESEPTETNRIAFSDARERHRDIVRDALAARLRDRLSALDAGETATWRLVQNRLTIPKPRLNSALTVNNSDVTDPKKQADAFVRHYARHSQGATKHVTKLKVRKTTTFFEITPEELKAAITTAATGKAAGEDEIFAEQLKQLPEDAFETLRSILNASLKTGEVPQLLRNSVIVPLLKPGKAGNVLDSYRPISLTSSISKVMERVVITRLWHVWCPHPHQFAFRKHYCTEDALACLHDFIVQNYATWDTWVYKKPNGGDQKGYKSNRVMAIFFDFSAAFDTVCHDIIAQKLRDLPDQYASRWMRNHLQARHGRVRIGIHMGRPALFLAGVPQGSVVGPPIFLLYVDSLLKQLNDEGLRTVMYADDLTVMIEGLTPQMIRPRATKAIDIVTAWAAKHRMKINESKCEAVLFTLSSHTAEDKTKVPLFINGKELKQCVMGTQERAKLLGIHLDIRCNFNEHMRSLVKVTRLRVAQLMSIAASTFGPKYRDLRTIARGYAESKLLYGAPVYGVPKTNIDDENRLAIRDLSAVHRAALRPASGVLQSAETTSQLLEANSMPLELLVLQRVLFAEEKYKRLKPPWLALPPPKPPPTGKRETIPPRIRRSATHAKYFTTPIHQREPRLLTSRTAPWLTSYCSHVSFGVDLPRPNPSLSAKEQCAHKLQFSLDALAPHDDWTAKLATDGSVRDSNHDRQNLRKVTVAASKLWLYGFEDTPEATQNCGPLACSYRTETIALRNGLALVRDNLYRILAHDREHGYATKLLIITDSQSALSALRRGPILQRNNMEDDIWRLLLDIAEYDVRIHLQFVYGHCGVPENEEIDQLSNSNFYTIPEVEPAWESDCRAHLLQQVTKEWSATLPTDTHRFRLVGAKTAPKSQCCLLTGSALSRNQWVQLARIRSGESEVFGRFYWATREMKDNCRFCCTQEDAPMAAPRDLEGRRKVICPFCIGGQKVISSHSNLVRHVQRFHPEETLALSYHCEICDRSFPSNRSLSKHLCRIRRRQDEANERNNNDSESNDEPMSDEEAAEKPPETIAHLLVCPAIQNSRDRHKVEHYHQRFGAKYFFSMKFLRWVHSIFEGPFATDDDVNERLLDDVINNNDEEEGDEAVNEDSDSDAISIASTYSDRFVVTRA
eukprot:GILI01006058.1.p1 GENE.GILI01006058.1~~GILI01006058.1.p1  ORF type:complete len:1145 (+),score=82.10 GILI01006058.1:283-3717(+)